ncbi:MAG: YHYH protein [Rhodospirillaceae bacterium]|nr:YHYH protein [Rhodospirillaceae bacterium]
MMLHLLRYFALPVCAVSVLLSPSFGLAHGIKSLGEQSEKAEKPVSVWNFLLNRAEAAQRTTIDKSGGYRYIKSDGLADHQTGTFPNRGNPHTVSKQSYSFRVSLKPGKAGKITELGHQDFGVALNGVPFDPLTAEYWNRDRSSGWNIEAMSGAINLGLDNSNAHVQPNGAYHYHAMPIGLLQKPSNNKNAPVMLGWAADGFPIYAPYGFGTDELKSSHRIKNGTRPSGPGGKYDGTYVQDYEYVLGAGDLDKCNGTTAKTNEFPNGTYLYVITNTYPFIPRCWIGKPDSSFSRTPGGGSMMGGNRPPPPSGGTGNRPPPLWKRK